MKQETEYRLKDSSKKIVFVGAGLSTLILALYLIRNGITGSRIVIIERSSEIGGQYSSSRSSNRVFDFGMHIYYETGIDEIDRCFLDVLPEEDWIFLEENNKDVAGIYWRGRLQTHSPYPDLRGDRLMVIRACLSIFGAFFKGLRRRNDENAFATLSKHFGHFLAVKVFAPILYKLYGVNAESLDEVALKLTAMNRVVMFNIPITLKLMKIRFFRERVGFPSQLELPRIRTKYGKGLYPRKFGFDSVIQRIEDILKSYGVTIATNSSVKRVEVSSDKSSIDLIKIEDVNNNQIELLTEQVFWMSVPIRLPEGLEVKPAKELLAEKKNGKKVFVNLLLDRKVESLNGLYYFYVFDKSSNIFRVTNYSGYCPDAILANNGLQPITIEYWAQRPMSADEVLDEVRSDLFSMGICKEEDIQFIEVANRNNDFPTPTREVMEILRERYNYLNSVFRNLSFCGTFSDGSNFFLHENLVSAFNTVKQRVNK